MSQDRDGEVGKVRFKNTRGLDVERVVDSDRPISILLSDGAVDVELRLSDVDALRLSDELEDVASVGVADEIENSLEDGERLVYCFECTEHLSCSSDRCPECGTEVIVA